jgi:hypothetical protein
MRSCRRWRRRRRRCGKSTRVRRGEWLEARLSSSCPPCCARLAPACRPLLLTTPPTLAPAAARAASRWFGPARPQLPPALGGGAPHLTGTVAGDYGFDPLGLARDEGAFARLHEAELLHARWGPAARSNLAGQGPLLCAAASLSALAARPLFGPNPLVASLTLCRALPCPRRRWAMLGAVGALIPEGLSMAGVELGEPVWWKVRGRGWGGGWGAARGRAGRLVPHCDAPAPAAAAAARSWGPSSPHLRGPCAASCGPLPSPSPPPRWAPPSCRPT